MAWLSDTWSALVRGLNDGATCGQRPTTQINERGSASAAGSNKAEVDALATFGIACRLEPLTEQEVNNSARIRSEDEERSKQGAGSQAGTLAGSLAGSWGVTLPSAAATEETAEGGEDLDDIDKAHKHHHRHHKKKANKLVMGGINQMVMDWSAFSSFAGKTTEDSLIMSMTIHGLDYKKVSKNKADGTVSDVRVHVEEALRKLISVKATPRSVLDNYEPPISGDSLRVSFTNSDYSQKEGYKVDCGLTVVKIAFVPPKHIDPEDILQALNRKMHSMSMTLAKMIGAVRGIDSMLVEGARLRVSSIRANQIKAECSECGSSTQIYCDECALTYCLYCSARAHGRGEKAHHNVEEVAFRDSRGANAIDHAHHQHERQIKEDMQHFTEHCSGLYDPNYMPHGFEAFCVRRNGEVKFTLTEAQQAAIEYDMLMSIQDKEDHPGGGWSRESTSPPAERDVLFQDYSEAIEALVRVLDMLQDRLCLHDRVKAISQVNHGMVVVPAGTWGVVVALDPKVGITWDGYDRLGVDKDVLHTQVEKVSQAYGIPEAMLLQERVAARTREPRALMSVVEAFLDKPGPDSGTAAESSVTNFQSEVLVALLGGLLETFRNEQNVLQQDQYRLEERHEELLRLADEAALKRQQEDALALQEEQKKADKGPLGAHAPLPPDMEGQVFFFDGQAFPDFPWRQDIPWTKGPTTDPTEADLAGLSERLEVSLVAAVAGQDPVKDLRALSRDEDWHGRAVWIGMAEQWRGGRPIWVGEILLSQTVEDSEMFAGRGSERLRYKCNAKGCRWPLKEVQPGQWQAEDFICVPSYAKHSGPRQQDMKAGDHMDVMLSWAAKRQAKPETNKERLKADFGDFSQNLDRLSTRITKGDKLPRGGRFGA